MTEELIAEIRAVVEQVPTVKELTAVDACALTDRVAQKFVTDPNRIWWWEALKEPGRNLHYEEEGGLDEIVKLLDSASAVVLVITDDSPRPWPAFKGPLGDILYVVGEQWFFEFFLVGEAEDWCVFDTHHNSLVITGVLC